MIEEIYRWEVICTSFENSNIKHMIICVEARTRKEAELIILEQAHKFFDQDMQSEWGNPIQGYRKID